jgi:hypothetical protein
VALQADTLVLRDGRRAGELVAVRDGVMIRGAACLVANVRYDREDVLASN